MEESVTIGFWVLTEGPLVMEVLLPGRDQSSTKKELEEERRVPRGK